MRGPRMAAAVVAAAAAAGGVGYRLLVGGALTVDLGWGRTVRPLGPFSVDIAAPPEVVFDVIAAPYLGRTPRAMADKLEVVERGSDLVLAAHRTPVRAGLVATTLETVRFDRPSRVDFRLVRGPVPHVVEHFLLHPSDRGTTLEYGGELGADLWAAGRWWGDQVARVWEAAVRSSFAGIQAEAERRTRAT
jgi:Polyketide cyclase / dehydrase and lipid transport